MNKNFSDAKEHFIKHGYCNASLKDIDLEFYNYLENNFVCDDLKNLQDRFFTIRYDDKNFNEIYQSPSESFIDAKTKKEEFLNSANGVPISQCWYFSYKLEQEERHIISKGIYNICKYFYDLPEMGSLNNTELQLSYYDKGCKFTPHHDGATVNLCSIIIYLNKNYKREYGGLLLLNGEEIIPEFGNIGLMDLSKHDISHGVTEVIDGPGRYAILDFPKLKPLI
jgi:Rps23 Pro-64 3,4-dihydroxylase Tpa1-like proline 4-hydroxylase